MLIESLELHNFRQFKETQKIVFSTDPDKPMTAIIGINTGGKTTIVQSFLWCLYGKTAFTDTNLLNADKLRELKNRPVGCEDTVFVRVKLVNGGVTYIIYREIKYIHSASNKISQNTMVQIKYIDHNGNARPIENASTDEIITGILPEELSEYFFFLGERIEKLDNRSNISKIVEDFLGITVIKNARKHLKSIITDLSNSYDENFSIDEKKLTDKILDYENKIDHLKKDNEEYNEQISKYEKLKADLEEEIRKNPDAAPLKRQLDDARRKLQRCKERLESSKKEFIRQFNNESYIYFSQELAKKAVSLIDSVPEGEKGLAYQSKNSLDELLKRKICLCGAKLDDPDSETYKTFMETYEMIAPKSITGMCDQYKLDVMKNENKINSYPKTVRYQFKEIRRNNDDIRDISEEIQNLDNQISTMTDMGPQKKKCDDYSKKIRGLQYKIGVNDEKIDSLFRIRKKAIDEKDAITKARDKNNKMLLYKNYAQAILDDINSDYLEKEENLHLKLNDTVKKYFNEMYHGERKLTLNKNYRIELATDDLGTKTDLSTGLETVKNFAFVAGLVDMAKEKMSGSKDDNGEEEGSVSEPYPLVLDAPFSSVDEVHIPNICRLLSSVVEQCIIVVMKKDWKYAEPVMENKVGQYYTLDKQNEVYTVIKSGYDKEGE